MKNIIKLFGIIALVMVIGFSMTSCGGGGGSSGSCPDGGVCYVTVSDGSVERMRCDNNSCAVKQYDESSPDGTYKCNCK